MKYRWLGPALAFGGFGVLMLQKGLLTTIPGLLLMGFGIYLVIKNRSKKKGYRQASSRSEVVEGPYVVELHSNGNKRRYPKVFSSQDEVMGWYNNKTDWEGIDAVKVLDLSKERL